MVSAMSHDQQLSTTTKTPLKLFGILAAIGFIWIGAPVLAAIWESMWQAFGTFFYSIF